jgi:hypothetical protein
MPKRQPGITLDDTATGFIMRRTTSDGKTTGLTLSIEDVLSITQSAIELQKRALSRIQPKGGSVTAVFATRVTYLNLSPDSLNENLLLQIKVQSGPDITLELPPPVAADFVDRSVDILSQMGALQQTRQ